MCVTKAGSSVSGHFSGRTGCQSRLREEVEENGEQHVTHVDGTDDSMFPLLWTLSFWCVLALCNQAVADEEAHWGATQSPPVRTPGFSFWPKIPSFPSSFPSILSRIPFYGSSDNKDIPTTSATGLVTSIDQDNLGSGEEEGSFLSAASQSPTASWQQGSWTDTKSLPTTASDSPRSSGTQHDNNILVSDYRLPTSGGGHYVLSDALFTAGPSKAPQKNIKHTQQPPLASEGDSTPSHMEKEVVDNQEKAKTYSTIAPETAVPTALTRGAVRTTTTMAAPVETTSPQNVKAAFVTTPRHLLSISGTESRPMEVTVTARNHRNLVPLGPATSAAPGLRVNSPRAGGKQSLEQINRFWIDPLDAIDHAQGRSRGLNSCLSEGRGQVGGWSIAHRTWLAVKGRALA